MQSQRKGKLIAFIKSKGILNITLLVKPVRVYEQSAKREFLHIDSEYLIISRIPLHLEFCIEYFNEKEYNGISRYQLFCFSFFKRMFNLLNIFF